MSKDLLHTSPRTSQDTTERVLSVSKITFEKINQKITEMGEDGEYLPKHALLKILLIAHYFRKDDEEQSINRKLKFIISNPSDRKYLTDILVELGIIKKTKNYRVGFNPNMYLFLEEKGFYTLNSEMSEEVEKILEKIVKRRKKKLDETAYLKGVEIHCDEKIEIDLAKALYEGDIEEIKSIENQKKLIEEINKGEFNMFRKDSGEKRLYSNITQLKKEYRKYLSFGNKDLVEIDIKSCHPLILPKIFEEFAVKREYDYLEIKSKGKNYHMKVWDIVALRVEIQEYYDLMDGGIYEVISDILKIDLNESKELFLKYMNDVDAKLHHPAFHYWFDGVFPIMSEMLSYFHYMEARGKSKKDGKNIRTISSFKYSIPFLCMQKESEMVLDKVCKSFRKLKKDEFVCNVHDAIIISSEFKEMIETMIYTKFKELNINVQTKSHLYHHNVHEKDQENLISPYSHISPIYLPYYVVKNDEKEPLIRTKPTNNGIVSDPSSAQNRNKVATIRVLKDGRFTISLKNKNINSRKGESLDQFAERVGYEKASHS